MGEAIEEMVLALAQHRGKKRPQGCLRHRLASASRLRVPLAWPIAPCAQHPAASFRVPAIPTGETWKRLARALLLEVTASVGSSLWAPGWEAALLYSLCNIDSCYQVVSDFL